MNATLHQLKWDFRHLRTPWTIWLLVLLASSYASHLAASAADPLSPLGQIANFARTVAIYPLAILLIARLMFATPFAGTRAFWKTRPLTQRSLFWTKSILILLLIHLPVALTHCLSSSSLNLGSPHLLWSTLLIGALTFAIYLFSAVWAALCERFGSFGLGLVASAAYLAILAICFSLLSDRLDSLPVHPRDSEFFGPITRVSTLLAMFLILAFTALAAWIMAARLKKRPAALGVLAVGLLLAAGAEGLWKTDFLRHSLSHPLPEVAVEAVVLDQDQPFSSDLQPLWTQLAVKLPREQFAMPTSWSATLVGDNQPALQSSSASGSASPIERPHFHRLAPFFPEGTRIVGETTTPVSLLTPPIPEGMPLDLAGQADLAIYAWHRIATLPFRPGASTPSADGGVIRVRTHHEDSLELHFFQPASPFRPLSDRHRLPNDRRNAEPVVVLHDPDAAVAFVARRRGYSGTGASPFSPTRHSETFELPADRLHALAGSDLRSDPPGRLRIEVFLPLPVGTARINFKKDDWIAYSTRPSLDFRPDEPVPTRPAVERLTLPPNPTADQLEAYLDSVLFNTSNNFSNDDWARIEADLGAIDPEHLPRLLNRLPVGLHARYLVFRVIPRMVRDEHRDAVLDALRRDSGLAPLVLARGWAPQAAPLVAALLRQHLSIHDENLPALIQIVAEQKDPTTYPDLRWHFTHAAGGQRTMARVLATCPGFPLDDALSELWSSARYDPYGPRFEIAALVARLGDKDALREAFRHYLDHGRPDDLHLLDEVVDGPAGDALPAWLHRNFAALQYNPATRTFHLP